MAAEEASAAGPGCAPSAVPSFLPLPGWAGMRRQPGGGGGDEGGGGGGDADDADWEGRPPA